MSMNFKLKPLVASMALLASGVAVASGFTPPEPAPVLVERLDKALERNHDDYFSESDWFRRITLSGEINVDGTVSNVTPSVDSRFGSVEEDDGDGDIDFSRNSSSDIALNDANLYLGSKINDWVMVNVNWLYSDRRGLYRQNNSDIDANLLDEAYVTVGNFHQSPFYFLAGKEYIPFGYYERHPITDPFTQLMTQTNATVAQLGFVGVSGFNGSIFAFRNKVSRKSTETQRIENGGAQVGYRYEQGDMGFNIDGSYLINMADVDYLESEFDLAPPTGMKSPNNIDQGIGGLPIVDGVGPGIYPGKTVGAYNIVLQGHAWGFDAEAQYVSAVRHFANTSPILWDGLDDDGDADDDSNGAKPSSWIVDVGYSFPVVGHDSRVAVGYQHSYQAVDFGSAGVPRSRWQADYAVNLWRNTDLGFEYVYDKDYNESHGGTGRNASTGIVRLSAKFA